MKNTYVNVVADSGAVTASLEPNKSQLTGNAGARNGGLLNLNDKRFMNVEELSVYLCISKWLVYKFVKDREIPFIPFGRLVRFDRLAVEKWAEKRMVRGFTARAA
jgi:excisionase family DNA binding protein